jgi:hypothetical protein
MKRPRGRNHPVSITDATGGELAALISDWLRRAGIGDGDERATIAVDLADALSSATHVGRRLGELLALDPRKQQEADQALTVAANMSVQLFEEMKPHLRSLERPWERLLKRLDVMSER